MANTKAIMVVHIYGLPVDMDPIFALAEKYGLAIIEDAAEMQISLQELKNTILPGEEKKNV